MRFTFSCGVKTGLWEGHVGLENSGGHWCKAEMVEDWIRVETECKARGSACVSEYRVPWVRIPSALSRDWSGKRRDLEERPKAQSFQALDPHSDSAVISCVPVFIFSTCKM